jgi:hypothetical protein
LLGAAVGVILFLAPPQLPVVTLIGLLIIGAFLVYPILNLPFVSRARKGSSKTTRAIFALALLGVAVASFGFLVWPPRRYLQITEKERSAFTEVLRQIPSPRERVILGCSQNNEEICVSAATFLTLFKEARWTVDGDRVQRGFLSKPQAGVVLLKKGTGVQNPVDPRSGLWVSLTAELSCIERAFSAVGIRANPPQADANLPEGVIAILFGPDPGRF